MKMASEVDMAAITENLVLRVTGMRKWRARFWLGSRLIRLGAWVTGCGVDIEFRQRKVVRVVLPWSRYSEAFRRNMLRNNTIIRAADDGEAQWINGGWMLARPSRDQSFNAEFLAD